MKPPAQSVPPAAENGATEAVPCNTQSAALGINLRRHEPLLNLFWILCGAAVCVYSLGLGVFGSSGPATGFFPMLAGVVMIVAGVALLAARGTRVDAALRFWPESGAARRVWLVLGGLIAMTLLMRFAGFILAALVMMPLLLRAIEGRTWPFVIAVGSVSAAAIYLLFDTLLGTILPRGPFGF